MVLSVHKMEFAPFRNSERAKCRVIGDRLGIAKARFACTDDFLHAGQVLQDFGGDLLRRDAAGEDAIGRLPAWREDSEAGNNKPRPALASSVGTGDSLA